MAQEEEQCARELLEVVPIVSRFIRTEMRRHRALGLSVPQFRTLAFTERTGGTTLGGVAEHLGLTPPSACKIVDGLEARELVTRMPSPEDRRKVNLQITPAGKRALTDAPGDPQEPGGHPVLTRRAGAGKNHAIDGSPADGFHRGDSPCQYLSFRT